MKQQRLTTFLFNLEDLLVDRLYRFSDSFFDDSREKTDFMDIKSIEFIIRNSGIAHLVIRKESLRLFMFLFELYEQLPICGNDLKAVCGKVIKKIRFRTLNMIGDFRFWQKRESETGEETDTEAGPERKSIPCRILITCIINGILTETVTKAMKTFRNQNPLITREYLCRQSPYHLAPG